MSRDENLYLLHILDALKRLKAMKAIEKIQTLYYFFAIVLSGFTLLVAFRGVNKVDYISRELQILQLADQCSWQRFDGGNYDAYARLMGISEDKTIDSLTRSKAADQLEKLRNGYQGSVAIVISIPVYGNVNGQLVVECQPICNWGNIVAQYKHFFWQTKAKVAFLFENLNAVAADELAKYSVTKKEVLEKLIDRIKSDESLIVRKTALDSFRKITGFEANTTQNVFHFQEAADWWHKTNDRF